MTIYRRWGSLKQQHGSEMKIYRHNTFYPIHHMNFFPGTITRTKPSDFANTSKYNECIKSDAKYNIQEQEKREYPRE